MLQESAEIKRRNAKLSDYYENLRTNVFSILGKNSTNKNIIFYNNCWCPEWNAIIYKRLDMNLNNNYWYSMKCRSSMFENHSHFL